MNYIKTFPEVSAADVNLVGGKGANLGQLASAGFPVPPGFCVTTDAYRAFVAANQLLPEILRLSRSAQANGPDAIETASAQMRVLFNAGQFPADLAAEIQSAYAQLSTSSHSLLPTLGAFPVAVRSSATTEDLAAASFAGQHDTYLNVQSVDSLLNSVKKCWASLWTAQAIMYRLRHDIEHEGASMAVVTQVMIPSDVSGVLFTLDPTSGDEQTIVINASWGLGEAIVSGIVTPDRFNVSKTNLKVLQQALAVKEKMIIGSNGGTAEMDTPAEKKSAASLTLTQAASLAEIGKRIETHYGTPQDVEWALRGEQIYILQARPITTRPVSPAPTMCWESPIPNAVWMRNSICDSWLTDPLSPLFATTLFPALIEGWVRGWMGVDDVRLTWSILPQPMQGTINGYAYLRLDIGGKPLEALRILFSTLRSYLFGCEKRWREKIHPGHLERLNALRPTDLTNCSNSEILRLATEAQYLSGEYWGAIGGLAWYWNAGEGALARVFDWLGLTKDRDADASYITLLQGFATKTFEAEADLYDTAQQAAGDSHLRQALQAGQAAGIHDLPPTPAGQELARRLRRYLEQFGHQVYNLDFVNPTSAEDSSSALLALRQHLEGHTQDPRVRLSAQAEQREALMARIFHHLRRSPLKRWLFLKVLHWAQRYSLVRDEMNFYFTLGWPFIRRCYLELGRRLVEAGALTQQEDVFFLEGKELEQALNALDTGKAVRDWREETAQRRAARKSQKRLVPPDIVPEGARLNQLFGLDLTDIALLRKRAEMVRETELRGSAVSPGRVTAPARVILSPEDFARLKPGDVLVAPYTTPAWTPLFASASGLVTDTGGALSHGSIVAREYGIPAVMGTQAATKRINDGQTITVDGYRGVVYLQ